MYKADHDLQLAADAIDRMASTTDMRIFVAAWEDFLFRLERAWEKCEASAKATGGRSAQSWLSANNQLRKKDPLLRYLRQARNAETHVVSTTLDAPLHLSISDRYGRPFRANSISISLEGTALILDVQSNDIGIEWSGAVEPSDPYLLRFKNRGEWYNPPRQHLKNVLVDLHPVAVATLGLHFYQGAYQAMGL